LRAERSRIKQDEFATHGNCMRREIPLREKKRIRVIEMFVQMKDHACDLDLRRHQQAGWRDEDV